jgi:hypothetical protein
MRRWKLEASLLPEMRAGDVLRRLVEEHGRGPRKSTLTRTSNRANSEGHGRVETETADYHVQRGLHGHAGMAVVQSDEDEAVLASLVQAIDDVCPVRFARLASAEFEYWQNAQDPLQYHRCPERLAGLPMVDNGLPPPLNRQVVDISRNPGRRVRRLEGVIEGVGHLMWFGADYSRVMRRKIKDLREAGGEWTEVCPGLWRVQLWQEPISDDSSVEVFDQVESFRARAFGDPSTRPHFSVPPPRGCFAHSYRIVAETPRDRKALTEWLHNTKCITTRKAARLTNPHTGEVLQNGPDLVRWHGHSDGWRRDFSLDPGGFTAVRPDSETAGFLSELANSLDLKADIKET